MQILAFFLVGIVTPSTSARVTTPFATSPYATSPPTSSPSPSSTPFVSPTTPFASPTTPFVPPTTPFVLPTTPSPSPTYSWVVDEYGSCTSRCDPLASQFRRVYCRRSTLSEQVTVSDRFCLESGRKPTESRTCLPENRCEYRLGAWSDCSVTCGDGTQTRTVQCEKVRGIRRELVLLEYCRYDNRPEREIPPTRRSCQAVADCIEYKWNVGDWSDCSAVCGNGKEERIVTCQSTVFRGTRRFPATRVEDSECIRNNVPPKPLSERACRSRCDYRLEPWSRCSVSCGSGVQTRRLECLRIDRSGSGAVVAIELCKNDSTIQGPVPLTERICSPLCILPPVIRLPPSAAPPPPPNRDLDFSVGQDVHIVNGRSLTIDCVVIQAVPDAEIKWTLENDIRLTPDEEYGRIEVNENATLTIKNVRNDDRGLYSCSATNVAGRDVAFSKITVYGELLIRVMKSLSFRLCLCVCRISENNGSLHTG